VKAGKRWPRHFPLGDNKQPCPLRRPCSHLWHECCIVRDDKPIFGPALQLEIHGESGFVLRFVPCRPQDILFGSVALR
jgi:hypothetical protein